MRMRSIEQKKVFKDVGFLLCCSLQQAAWCIVRRCTDIRYENAEHRDACAACLCLVSVAALSSNKRKIKNHTSKYRVPLFGKVVRGIFLGKFSSTKVILIQRALYFGGQPLNMQFIFFCHLYCLFSYVFRFGWSCRMCHCYAPFVFQLVYIYISFKERCPSHTDGSFG